MNNNRIIKDKKMMLLIIPAFIIGVVLIIFGSSGTNEKTLSENTRSNDGIDYSSVIEEKIEAFLGSVEGIDFVKVFVTVDGGNELELAEIGGADGYASDYLVIDRGNEEEAAVVREVYPQIRGIAVACTGGNSPAVQKTITDLLSAALGISTNNIMVAGYK